MEALAVVLQAPEQLEVSRLALDAQGEADVVVDISFSGISTGTERKLWNGTMPQFPGMGYPLVPGYESVGVVREAGPASGLTAGQTVFVPGAKCFGPVRGLFGASASRLVVPGARVIPIDGAPEDRFILLSLAATAYHAIKGDTPDLIVGHGVLGRLAARLAVIAGGSPTVWETNATRRPGGEGLLVIDSRQTTSGVTTACILDMSGDDPASIRWIGASRAAAKSFSPASTTRIELPFPARLHARGRARASRRIQETSDCAPTTALVAAEKTFARRPDHPSQRARRGRRRVPDSRSAILRA